MCTTEAYLNQRTKINQMILVKDYALSIVGWHIGDKYVDPFYTSSEGKIFFFRTQEILTRSISESIVGAKKQSPKIGNKKV